jgi:hypothetical protein
MFRTAFIILALALVLPAQSSAAGNQQEPIQAERLHKEAIQPEDEEATLHKEPIPAPSRERGTASSEIAPSREGGTGRQKLKQDPARKSGPAHEGALSKRLSRESGKGAARNQHHHAPALPPQSVTALRVLPPAHPADKYLRYDRQLPVISGMGSP